MTENKVENPDIEVTEATAEAVETPEAPVDTAPKVAPKPQTEPKGGYWWGTGRRKSSVARVRIKPGSGKLMVNKKDLGDYFKRTQDQNAVVAPLKAVQAEKLFDVFINVRGGGTTGQSGASLLGIARALKRYDEGYVQALRDGGHLTRDPRMVERKKPGQRGARRRFQFSKR
ncbi:MAG TPA: 30S ribosomal protein S9 [Phycisphaerales bacterium]|nr:30S ribosomal protein S9 [Phycisphaerales bacterium]